MIVIIYLHKIWIIFIFNRKRINIIISKGNNVFRIRIKIFKNVKFLLDPILYHID